MIVLHIILIYSLFYYCTSSSSYASSPMSAYEHLSKQTVSERELQAAASVPVQEAEVADGEGAAPPADVVEALGRPGWHVGRKGRPFQVQLYSKELSKTGDERISEDFPLRSTWIKSGDTWLLRPVEDDRLGRSSEVIVCKFYRPDKSEGPRHTKCFEVEF